MASVNKVILIGNLGADPETRAVNDTMVANFRIATTDSWTKDGEKKEKTEWHSIVVWGKLAELCGKYLSKGKSVYVEGKLQTREWEKDGVKRYSTEVVATAITFLSPKVSSDGSGASSGSGSQAGDEDIPF